VCGGKGGGLLICIPKCNKQQLEVFEDVIMRVTIPTQLSQTVLHRAGSGRDLCWFTWDCWYVIFNNLYGQPKDEEIIELAGDPPVDYTPPPGGQFAQPGRAEVCARARGGGGVLRKPQQPTTGPCRHLTVADSLSVP
jgi:hypothetical protein